MAVTKLATMVHVEFPLNVKDPRGLLTRSKLAPESTLAVLGSGLLQSPVEEALVARFWDDDGALTYQAQLAWATHETRRELIAEPQATCSLRARYLEAKLRWCAFNEASLRALVRARAITELERAFATNGEVAIMKRDHNTHRPVAPNTLAAAISAIRRSHDVIATYVYWARDLYDDPFDEIAAAV